MGHAYYLLFIIYLKFIHCCCSVAQLCPTRCDPMDCSMPGFLVFHYLLKFAQTQVHWVNDEIQPSHPLSSPSPPALNLSQNQGLFQWVGPSHQVAKVLELHSAWASVFPMNIQGWFPLPSHHCWTDKWTRVKYLRSNVQKEPRIHL